MKQLFNALSYIHDNNIIHMNLKLDALMLLVKENFNSLVLTDWGLSD